MTWLRRMETENAPHFMKGAIVALLGWMVFMLLGPLVSLFINAAVLAGFFLLTKTRPLYAGATFGLLAATAFVLWVFGEFGPLGFALTATMTLAVGVEFWQLTKGDKSDGFDFKDLLFDFLGWLYLAGVVEAWEWLAM